MFVTIVRSLLGLLLLALGVVGFTKPMYPPADLPAVAKHFADALESTGYVYPLIGGVEVLCGALLLFKRWVPFALVLLAPLSVHIVLFHAFLDPPITHALMGYSVATANLVLGALHWDAYRGLFR